MREASSYLSTQFLEHIWPHFAATFQSKTSVELYFSDLCSFVEYTKKDILSATQEDCDAYVQYLLKELQGGKLKKSTVVKKYRELASVCSYLKKHREKFSLPENYENPFADIVIPEYECKINYNKTLTLETIDLLVGYMKENDELCLIATLLAFKLLLRTSEFINLKFSDIMIDASGNKVVRILTRNKAYRYLRLTEDIYELIEKQCGKSEPIEYVFQCPGKEKAYSTRVLQNRLSNAFDCIGSEHYQFNDLRNTGITYCHSNGASIDMIADALGHTSTTHINRLESLTVHFSDLSEFNHIDVKFNNSKK